MGVIKKVKALFCKEKCTSEPKERVPQSWLSPDEVRFFEDPANEVYFEGDKAKGYISDPNKCGVYVRLCRAKGYRDGLLRKLVEDGTIEYKEQLRPVSYRPLLQPLVRWSENAHYYEESLFDWPEERIEEFLRILSATEEDALQREWLKEHSDMEFEDKFSVHLRDASLPRKPFRERMSKTLLLVELDNEYERYTREAATKLDTTKQF